MSKRRFNGSRQCRRPTPNQRDLHSPRINAYLSRFDGIRLDLISMKIAISLQRGASFSFRVKYQRFLKSLCRCSVVPFLASR